MMIRCYAEGRPGSWEAVCLEFDLAVQGESLEEVQRSIEEAIAEYLEYVKDLPEDEQRRFIHRRAPWRLRARFLWYALLITFKQGQEEGKHRAEFLIPATV